MQRTSPAQSNALPPHAVTIDQFAAKSTDFSTAVRHGDKPGLLARRLNGLFKRLDPLQTLEARGARAEMLCAGLGHAALVASGIDKKRTSKQVQGFATEVLVGHAVAAAQTEKPELIRASLDDLDTAESQLASRLAKLKSMSNEKISLKLDLLNVRAIRARNTLALAGESLRGLPASRAKEAFARTELAGLIGDSAAFMSELQQAHEQNQDARKGAASVIAGRLTELMYFTYSVAKWYRSDDLRDGSVRLAMGREDQPDSRGYTPYRNFDLVLNDRPVQVKYGAASGTSKYAPEIDVVKLPAIDFEQEVPQLVGWFQDLASPKTTIADSEAAWMQLQMYFEPIIVPVQQPQELIAAQG